MPGGRPPRDRAGEDEKALEALEQWLRGSRRLELTRPLTEAEKEELFIRLGGTERAVDVVESL